MSQLSRYIVLFSFILMSHCVVAGEKVPELDGPTSHYVTVSDGVKIHYLTLGEGEPILLIHGYYASASLNWFANGIAQELAKTHLVIALDQRGHGKSSQPLDKDAYGLNMWKDAVAVLDDMKVEKAHVHGYSMGGTILTQMLFYTPERVLSAVYGGSGIPETDIQEQKKIQKDSVADKEAIAEEDEAQKILLADGPNHFALHALSKNSPGKGEAAKLDLANIKIPVMAINGEFDSPNKKTHKMKRLLSDFTNVVLPRKSHLTAITPGFIPAEYLQETVKFTLRNSEKVKREK